VWRKKTVSKRQDELSFYQLSGKLFGQNICQNSILQSTGKLRKEMKGEQEEIRKKGRMIEEYIKKKRKF
jgi:hypothetical protein